MLNSHPLAEALLQGLAQVSTHLLVEDAVVVCVKLCKRGLDANTCRRLLPSW